MRRLVLAAALLAGCRTWRQADNEEQRERAESIRVSIESRGKLGDRLAASAAGAVAEAAAEAVGEKFQEAAPRLVAGAERAAGAALDAAQGVAQTATDAAKPVAEAAAKVVAAPLVLAGAGAVAAADALRPKVQSETMERFARAHSAKLTRCKVDALLEWGSEHRKNEAASLEQSAAVISELDPETDGAQDYLWDLLGDPRRELRQAAAARLASAAR